jgi:chromosomal replication initiation ATPase DnaA
MDPVRAIVEHAAVVFKRTPEELLGRSRKQPIAEARQAAMWAVRQRYPSIPLEGIGRAIGGRHYTTVMHALTTVEERAVYDPVYAENLCRLLIRIGGTAANPGRTRQATRPQTAAWWLMQTSSESCRR